MSGQGSEKWPKSVTYYLNGPLVLAHKKTKYRFSSDGLRDESIGGIGVSLSLPIFPISIRVPSPLLPHPRLNSENWVRL